MPSTDFPVVEGVYQLTDDWSVSLLGEFKRRIEDGDLVLWSPKLTLWIAVWKNDQGASKESRLDSIKKAMSSDAEEIKTSASATLLRLSYRLREEEDAVAAVYGFAVGERGQVEMAIYPEEETDVSAAQAILQSLTESKVA